jgi:hypothetical protein
MWRIFFSESSVKYETEPEGSATRKANNILVYDRDLAVIVTVVSIGVV